MLRLTNGSSSLLHLLAAGVGPTLPTWTVPQVGSYLRYTGRDANVVQTAARDPKPSRGWPDSRNGTAGVLPV